MAVLGSARAFVGLSVLGWGFSILLGVAPHEDRVAGAGLAVFGVAMLATARRFPRIERLPPLVVGGFGFAAAGLVLAYDLWFGASLNLPKVALVVLGVALATSGPWLDASLPVPFRRGARVPVATLVSCALPVLGAPLAVWGVQALFESTLGRTPVEFFLRWALLAPLGGVLELLGLAPLVDGQTLAYATPRGRMAVNVGAACSGIQAMALFTGVLALFLLVERPRGGRLALWSAIGVLGVYVANLLRLVALTLIGYRWGGDALLQAHAQAGWVVFVAWALLFAWLARTPAPRPTAA